MGWTQRRIVFLVVVGLLTTLLVAYTREVMLPFILAAIIAYVLTPLVALFERIRVPRAVAILLVYALVFAALYCSIAAMAPRLYAESSKLVREAPTIAAQLADKWGPRFEGWVDGLRKSVGKGTLQSESDDQKESASVEIRESPDGGYLIDIGRGLDIVQLAPDHWQVGPAEGAGEIGGDGVVADGVDRFITYVEQNTLQVVKLGQQVIAIVSRGIFLLFMTLMVAGYLMYTRERVVGFFKSLVPESTGPRFDTLLWRVDRGLAGVVRGQLVICLVNGLLSAFGFWLFDLKYWPVLAIVAALMSLVPIFGSILSTIPVVVVGLTQDFWTAFWVLIWVLGIHQIEANFLNPKIIGDSARIHPVLVVFSLIVGEHFFGLWGALFAVPTLSVAQSLFNHFRFEVVASAQERDRLSVSDRPPGDREVAAEAVVSTAAGASDTPGEE